MIAGPLLLLILPLAMAGIVYILLRWAALSGPLAIGTALVLGFAVVTLPLDQPVRVWGGSQIALGEAVTFFGRELILEQADRDVDFGEFDNDGLTVLHLGWGFLPGVAAVTAFSALPSRSGIAQLAQRGAFDPAFDLCGLAH